MPTFQYSAKDSRGYEKQGNLEARNQKDAEAKLISMGLKPLVVFDVDAVKSKKTKEKKVEKLGTGRMGAKDLCMFTRQMTTLLQAGLPLLRALRTLARQAEKKKSIHRVIEEMADFVEGGGTFSEALNGQPKTFNRLYVSMVKAGEASGALDVVLLRLAEFLEKAERIKRKVKSAMTYPIVVMVVAVGITIALMYFIVPKFEEMFREMLGDGLPWITQLVINTSRFIQANILWILIASVFFGIMMRYALKTKKGSELFDAFLIKTPPINSLTVRVVVARFSRTLGTLMNAGVPVLQALQIVKDTVNNAVVSNAVVKVHDSVREGEGITRPLNAQHIFPDMTIAMIEVGEETGALPDMLNRVADIYEEEVDAAVDALTSLLEPIMIVLLAGVVGTIVIAMFMPMIKMIEGMSQQ